jgi:hypothetical protein
VTPCNVAVGTKPEDLNLSFIFRFFIVEENLQK